MRLTGWIASTALAIVLSACGGGGGGSDPIVTAPGFPSPTVITGTVVPGPVSGAKVQLFSVDAQGRTTLMQEVSTGNDGAYSFNAGLTANTVVMVAAAGGTWTDPMRKTTANLDTKLRAVEVWTGPTQRVNITPYTEVVTRSIEKSKAPTWTVAAVRAANDSAAQDLGVARLTDFGRLDLTQPPTGTANTEDVAHALVNGSFVGFWHRLETTPGTLSMAAAVDALDQLTNIDDEDDRLGPAYLGGSVDFLDVTTLTADAKRQAKGLILYGKDILPTDFTIAQAMPKGVSSGAGTAPMPDNAFKLLGAPEGTTHFNLRGALVSYGEGDGKTSRHELYSGSVAEVFADGDVGIGRWNGGVQMVTVPTGGGSSMTNPEVLPDSGVAYAAARATSQVPSCGMRRLSLAGSTPLAKPSGAVSTQPALTLTTDSALSTLYLDHVQFGVDIGVKTAAGEVVRLQSTGALTHPELAGMQFSPEEPLILNVPVSALFPSGTTAQLIVRAAGTGARKAAAFLQIRRADGDGYSAALAFVAPDTAPDVQGCAQPGAAGIGISPLPATGSYFVFLSQNSDSLYMGVPKDDVRFGAAGELTGVINTLRLSGPAYDLAGNAKASIGRVTVSTGSAENGNLVVRSQPYAVAQQAESPPPTGSSLYQLVAATAVTAERGSGDSQLAPGTIDSASVSVVFNSSGTGTAHFNIAGHFAGVPFGSDVTEQQGFGPLELGVGWQNFADFGKSVTGAFAGPTGNHLVVVYQTGVAGIPIKVALLFKRQGS